MPFTATSLAQFLASRSPDELTFALAHGPLREHAAPPKGALARFHLQGYSTRYGLVRYSAPKGGEAPSSFLRVGIVVSTYALFVFHPARWAPRLPVLRTVSENVAVYLEGFDPGTPLFPGAQEAKTAKAEHIYRRANDQFQFWWNRKPYWSGDPTCWVEYTVRPALLHDEMHNCYLRQLASRQMNAYLSSGEMVLPSDFPDERKESLKNFPETVYIREDSLRVLGHSPEEWRRIYRFYILEVRDSQPLVIVLDRSAQVIVAVFITAPIGYIETR